MDSTPITAVRRKMRKGTKSCLECRRRKIRCTFPPGEPECLSCKARSSRCIDQQQGYNVTSISPNLETDMNGRRDDHVSLYMITSPNGHVADVETPNHKTDNRAPLGSVLGDAKLPWQGINPNSDELGADCTVFPTNYSAPLTSIYHPEKTAANICEILRSALPEYDNMMSTLLNKGAWWNACFNKMQDFHDDPFRTLASFAMCSYTSNDPSVLAILAAAYARCSNTNHHLHKLVENLILSDPYYSSTIEGMQCLILLAKSYVDFGQPHKAWLLYRRGLATAQLMGIYRKKSNSIKYEKIWWSIYHGDRFTSMILGLPYGFKDTHCDFSFNIVPNDSISFQRRLMLGCDFISGKIIDCNLLSIKPLPANTIELDEQMIAIRAVMPAEWWDLPHELPNSRPQLDQLRDRLLQQFYFFHVKAYLHMPFIVKSNATVPNHPSIVSYMDAARQLLRIFLILRTEVNGSPFFECKTSDFLSFTVAAIFLISLSSQKDTLRSESRENDAMMIDSIKYIVQADWIAYKSRIYSNYYRTLELLSSIQFNRSKNFDCSAIPDKIRIPYFGTVVKKCVYSSARDIAVDCALKDGSEMKSHSTILESDINKKQHNYELGLHNMEGWNSSLSKSNAAGIIWEMDSLGKISPDIPSLPLLDLEMTNDDNDNFEYLNVEGTSLILDILTVDRVFRKT